MFLPEGYHAFPEHTIQSKPKLQVDIVIKKDNKIIFLIELKTNLGYDRGSVGKTDNISELKVVKRRQQIADACQIDKKNVIFILASFGNVNKYFREQFWITSGSPWSSRPIDLDKRNKLEPFNFIYPLFNKYDPHYFYKSEYKDIDPYKQYDPYKKYNNQQLAKIAKDNICTPFEYILDLITNAK